MVARTDLGLIIERAENYLSLLRSEGIGFESAYLFGSHEKGTAHEDSDIDIALIAEQWLPDSIDSRFELMKLASRIDSRIEPHPIEKNRIEESDPFVCEILSTGRLL